MIDPEHTPGPWRVNGSSIWSDQGYVAELSCPRGPDQRDIDARLISAAPEMLHALLEFVSMFNTIPGSIGDEVKENAFKAIAKAVGRDPRS